MPKKGKNMKRQAPNTSGGARRANKLSLRSKRPENAIVRIKHREFVTDVLSSTDWTVWYREINPGLAETFPWLAGIAMNFESYKFVDLKFIYSPVCSTLTKGSVNLALDYDVTDYPPTSKQQMMSYQGAVRTAPWDEITLDVKKVNLANLVKERNCRSHDIPDTDPRLFDVACLYLARSGCADSGAVLGELYVEYTVDLMIPQLDEHVSPYDSAKLTGGGVFSLPIPLGTGVTNTNADENRPILVAGNNGVNSVLHFKKPGEYLLSTKFSGTGMNTTYPTLEAIGETLATFSNVTQAVLADGTSGIFDQEVKVDHPGDVKFAAPATWTTLTGTILRAAPYLTSMF